MYLEVPDVKFGLRDGTKIPEDVPSGARWEDLTEEQQNRIRSAMRFGGYIPESYQATSGNGDCY